MKRHIRTLVLLSLGIGGCDAPSSPAPSPNSTAPSAAPPAEIQIAGDVVESGFSGMRLRKSTWVGSFSISSSPVSVAEYRACVVANVCSPPDADAPACSAPSTRHPLAKPTWNEPEASSGDLPITCVSPAQAATFCSWVGGQLPTLEQWLLAARGRKPTRFPWGDEPPACDKAATAETDPATGLPCCSWASGCDPTARFRMRAFRDGRSERGLYDVLLGEAELVAPAPDSLIALTREAYAQVVAGPSGAIHHAAVAPASGPAIVHAERPTPPQHAVPTFRCVRLGAIR